MVMQRLKSIPPYVLIPLLVFVLALVAFISQKLMSDAVQALRPSVDETIRAMIPDTDIQAINPTPLDGVYEVVAGQNIFYMQPGKPYLLVGHLFDLSTAEDLTQLKKNQRIQPNNPTTTETTP